jgi:hypothetical protein
MGNALAELKPARQEQAMRKIERDRQSSSQPRAAGIRDTVRDFGAPKLKPVPSQIGAVMQRTSAA